MVLRGVCLMRELEVSWLFGPGEPAHDFPLLLELTEVPLFSLIRSTLDLCLGGQRFMKQEKSMETNSI